MQVLCPVKGEYYVELFGDIPLHVLGMCNWGRVPAILDLAIKVIMEHMIKAY